MTTRKTRLRLSRRGQLIIIGLSALCAWGGLLLFTYYVPPVGQAVLVVFLLLALSLWCTSTLLIYFVTWAILARRLRRPSLLQAGRESGLFSAWLVFNLLLSALSSWSLFSAIISFGFIVVIEILVLSR